MTSAVLYGTTSDNELRPVQVTDSGEFVTDGGGGDWYENFYVGGSEGAPSISLLSDGTITSTGDITAEGVKSNNWMGAKYLNIVGGNSYGGLLYGWQDPNGTVEVIRLDNNGSQSLGDPSSGGGGTGTGGMQFTASNGQLDIVNTGSGDFISCYNRNTATPAASISAAGVIEGTAKNFRIPHPLPSKINTHFLVHSSIEGPQADLIYRGQVVLLDGIATVNIDTAARMTEGTFEMLSTNVSCFTSNETDWDPVKGSVSGNILTIESQDATGTATVSWLVVCERKDQSMLHADSTDEKGRLITEPLKPVEAAAE